MERSIKKHRKIAPKDNLPQPHGGCGLIDRMIPEIERDHFVQKALKHKVYAISNADLSTFYRIADGTLSPLEGPMNEKEFSRVLDEEVVDRSGKKYAWTIPLAFPVSKKDGESFTIGETVAVKNEHGVVVGALEISDIYHFDKKKYNRIVYGTERLDHPGARIVTADPRDWLIGGKLWALPQHKHPVYGKYMLSPKETRALFHERKWERIVAFQTRNPLHRAHEYAMVYGMEKLTKDGFFTGVILNPLVGETKSDDVPADVRMKTYEVLIENKLLGHGDKDSEFWKKKDYDLDDQMLLVGLDIKMFYAGPKEAVMHAVYRQNHGFTDIIIGRKHADAPFDDGTAAWGDFDAQQKFDHPKGKLLIKPLKVGFAAYFEELGKVALVDIYKDKGFHQVTIAGKALREKLVNGDPVDERIIHKPVADILSQYYREHAKLEVEKLIRSRNVTWHDSGITKADREKRSGHKGAILWFTGLPSSGKSTIAVELQAQLFERGHNIFILDGDNVRHGLNSNLAFSPEDRQENIRRVGEVAKLFADAGFLVITAFISPYKKDRDLARSKFQKGDFVEVFVNTILATCEKRDPKGLYQKARRGEVKEFTGISAPYEKPENPEVIINTENETREESAQFLIEYLEDNGYIPRKVTRA